MENRMIGFTAAFLALALLFPNVASAHDGPLKQSLLRVERWLLLLNNELEEPVASRIANSPYDMAVVDNIATLAWNRGLNVRPKVEALKKGPKGRRLIISYLNAGQAEDYRSYFRPEWKKAPPAWVIGADPEGWEGNFPVAYWRKEWQAILLGPSGLVQKTARDGFDGAYLDWVAAYHDEAVLKRAEEDGVDAQAEMVKLILAIARNGRAVNPDFLVIAQNVPDLASNPDIIEAVSAFVQEGIWFDGAQDDKPPGDCPLPRSAAEARSASYAAKLPPECRRARDEGRANILNYAQEDEIVPYLSAARSRGLAVFTVDYAVKPENIAAAAKISRSFGFKPFVGARALKEYRDPNF